MGGTHILKGAKSLSFLNNCYGKNYIWSINFRDGNPAKKISGFWIPNNLQGAHYLFDINIENNVGFWIPNNLFSLKACLGPLFKEVQDFLDSDW